MSEMTPPCTIVIFGAAGDLTPRLLIPSIYNLAAAGLLDPGLRIIGADHNERTAAGWGEELSAALHASAIGKNSETQPGVDERAWSFVAERLDYIKLDFTNDADYDALAKRIDANTSALFYFAVSPRFFETVASGLAKAGLLVQQPNVFRRMVIEKPFGRDAASAQQLNTLLTSLADETQIYRIDHFLGKEAVQGIPALRWGSRALEPLLDRRSIESVQITAAETVGVEDRGSFYETAGALRDMVPNHLFSLLTLVAMDAPATYEADPIRDAKAALLGSLRHLTAQDAARGQYAAGTLDGKSVPAYREEGRVAHDSRTETYAALRCYVDNDRWRDVPFYIRTGKRMAQHLTTVALLLRPPDGLLDASATEPQVLVLGIDPQRGVALRFAAKEPGVDLSLGSVHMGFRYDKVFNEPPSIGYETLIYDALRGHALLFQRDDMIHHEWATVQGILDAWEGDPSAPEPYAPGSAGPGCADALLAEQGHRWLDVGALDAFDPQPALAKT